jgi:hypothetical protein
MMSFDRWASCYEALLQRRGGPLPDADQRLAEQESRQIAADHHAACLAAIDRLRQALQAAAPDLVVMFGDDQLENLQPTAMPPFTVFAGPETFGYPYRLYQDYLGEASAGERRVVPGAPDYAQVLLCDLAERGFDVAHSQCLADEQWGLSHSIINIIELLDVVQPVLPVFVNAFYEPAATPARCFALGQAIRDSLEARTPPEFRIAVVGSGGLSHITRGDRAGHIDHAHDRWVADTLLAGQPELLAQLSVADLWAAADQELREWLPAVGMVGHVLPDWLELISSYWLIAGNGFAVWSLENAEC